MNEMQAAAQTVQGIKTDLFAIEKYVDEVVQEIKCKCNELTFCSELRRIHENFEYPSCQRPNSNSLPTSKF